MSENNPYIERLVDLSVLLDQKSHFLLGPRQTGKTSLIRHTLKNVRVYDLLDPEIFLSLSRAPGRISEELQPQDRIVAIDEIQRLPELLNEVHRLIETRGIRFLLTGSSARKLRRGGINLLGGRARTKYLHPLTYKELNEHFDLFLAIERGTIPSIYFSDEPRADLQAYAGSYLQQEILAEGATRNIPAFSRFLRVAALCNATIVNFTNVANDAQVARTTVYEYFEILKDTLLLYELPACDLPPRTSPPSKLDLGPLEVHSREQNRVLETWGVWPPAPAADRPRRCEAVSGCTPFATSRLATLLPTTCRRSLR